MSEDTPISDQEIEAALAKVKAGSDCDLNDVLCLVFASFERERPIAPEVLQDAVAGKYQTEKDYANGGADQFVWNNGAELARIFGNAWVQVGAKANGELLLRLAAEYETYRGEVGDEAITADPVKRFLDYRKRVKGPFFGIVEPDEELFEVLVEWAIRNPEAFNAP